MPRFSVSGIAGALENCWRVLEDPEGVPAPATHRDFTLERVRDYILYLREHLSKTAQPGSLA